MGSWSQTNQQDNRTAIEAETASGPHSALSMPGSIAVGEYGSYSFVDNSQVPENLVELVEGFLGESQAAYAGLLDLNERAMQGIFAENERLMDQNASTSEPSAYLKYLPYAIIGFFIILYFSR